MEKPLLALLSAFVIASPAWAQNSSPIPSGSGSLSHYLLERQDILSGGGECTALRPYMRRQAVAANFPDDTSVVQTLEISRDQDYLNRDNSDFLGEMEGAYASKKPFLRYFYRHSAHFYQVNRKHFRLAYGWHSERLFGRRRHRPSC